MIYHGKNIKEENVGSVAKAHPLQNDFNVAMSSARNTGTDIGWANLKYFVNNLERFNVPK